MSAARAGSALRVDLHGLSVKDAVATTLRTLRAQPPRTPVHLISGLGLHSVGGVSAIKTELERCFDEWKVRWRWEHGVFIVLTPDSPATLAKAAARGSGTTSTRPQVAVASRSQMAPWASSRPGGWVQPADPDAALRPEAFPALSAEAGPSSAARAPAPHWGSEGRQQEVAAGRAAGVQPREAPEPEAWPRPEQQEEDAELAAALEASRQEAARQERREQEEREATLLGIALLESLQAGGGAASPRKPETAQQAALGACNPGPESPDLRPQAA